ncbi:MAG: imidazole glycerol phosphate synthase subunit HisH [Thermodesulfobacteriota bacterium]
MLMIAIVDYGMGNLRSVSKGFESQGFSTTVTRNPDDIRKSSGLVLPGVGSFGDCVRNLKEFGLIEPIIEFINKDKPFLGICLGLQILFEESQESSGIKGLSLFKGKVVRFPRENGSNLKIPHMGWNQVELTRELNVLREIPRGSWFYFVHSYYPEPEEKDIITGKASYGVDFTCAVSKGNIFACQFHPEKSSSMGLKILENFALLCGEKKERRAEVRSQNSE